MATKFRLQKGLYMEDHYLCYLATPQTKHHCPPLCIYALDNCSSALVIFHSQKQRESSKNARN